MTTDASRRPEHGAEGSADGPNPRLIAALKLAVVGMGVLIVVGLSAVIWKILVLANEPAAGTAPRAEVQGAAATAAATAALAPEVALAIPAGAAVRTVSLNGNRLAVHYDAPQGPGTAILDLETGRTLSRVRLTGEAR